MLQPSTENYHKLDIISEHITNPLSMISASTMTGMVIEAWLFETVFASSGFELFAAISIFIGLAFDSFKSLPLASLPTTRGRMIVFKDIWNRKNRYERVFDLWFQNYFWWCLKDKKRKVLPCFAQSEDFQDRKSGCVHYVALGQNIIQRLA